MAAGEGSSKPPIRWDWIEEQWQLGRLSNVAIAARHREQFGRAVAESAIRKRASQNGWQRDLADAIRRETRRKLAESATLEEVRESANALAPSHQEIALREVATVESASDEAVRITLTHRTHAERMHATATALEMYVMRALPLHGDGTPALEYEPGELKDIAAAVSSASNTRGRAIDIERRAYGLDDPDANKGSGSLSELRAFLASSGP